MLLEASCESASHATGRLYVGSFTSTRLGQDNSDFLGRQLTSEQTLQVRPRVPPSCVHVMESMSWAPRHLCLEAHARQARLCVARGEEH